ncbi:MAG: protein kinase [Anaerolineae bacterium]|nr:protein kinase [Anaerolineae bacterium]
MHPPEYLKNRYRLGEQLGRGGMAVIYRARDETLDRDVAIKFLPPQQIAGAGARFMREARAVARLSHPNIMALYDVDREGAWRYLVLEHIPGQDLHTMLVERGEPLPVDAALHIMRDVLRALAYAHAQGVIHRDIKPDNIMVTPQGQVKITDFGLALPQGDIRLTREYTLVGTVLYMAPEAVTGKHVDHRADLYAAGAVLYELLTGQPPFLGSDAFAVASQILNTPAAPPRQINVRIPLDIERVVVKLLAKDPAQRYASAEETLAALPGAPAAGLPAGSTLPEQLTRRPAVSAPEPAEGSALARYAALEDAAAAVEAERRRLAALLESSVIDSLNLLLSQAGIYEQTLTHPQAHMAVSILASLARQVIQQARDLGANLHPATLEALGLEPALEALANRAMRAHGLQVTLGAARLRERLPPRVELALFRAAQDALERAARQSHASQVTIRLEQNDERLRFSFSDNGAVPTGSDLFRSARRRIEQLGGVVETGVNAHGGFELTITFRAEAPVELTPREMEVIQLLAEGLSNKEIAQVLTISPRTVNFHLDNIVSKQKDPDELPVLWRCGANWGTLGVRSPPPAGVPASVGGFFYSGACCLSRSSCRCLLWLVMMKAVHVAISVSSSATILSRSAIVSLARWIAV